MIKVYVTDFYNIIASYLKFLNLRVNESI